MRARKVTLTIMAPCIFSSPSFLHDLFTALRFNQETRREGRGTSYFWTSLFITYQKQGSTILSLSFSFSCNFTLLEDIYIYRERKIDIYWVIRKVILVFFSQQITFHSIVNNRIQQIHSCRKFSSCYFILSSSALTVLLKHAKNTIAHEIERTFLANKPTKYQCSRNT